MIALGAALQQKPLLAAAYTRDKYIHSADLMSPLMCFHSQTNLNRALSIARNQTFE